MTKKHWVNVRGQLVEQTVQQHASAGTHADTHTVALVPTTPLATCHHWSHSLPWWEHQPPSFTHYIYILHMYMCIYIHKELNKYKL